MLDTGHLLNSNPNITDEHEAVIQIDTHSPMTFPGTLEFIKMIDPEYLVYEITESNRTKLAEMLDLQNSIFG